MENTQKLELPELDDVQFFRKYGYKKRLPMTVKQFCKVVMTKHGPITIII